MNALKRAARVNPALSMVAQCRIVDNSNNEAFGLHKRINWKKRMEEYGWRDGSGWWFTPFYVGMIIRDNLFD